MVCERKYLEVKVSAKRRTLVHIRGSLVRWCWSCWEPSGLSKSLQAEGSQGQEENENQHTVRSAVRDEVGHSLCVILRTPGLWSREQEVTRGFSAG